MQNESHSLVLTKCSSLYVSYFSDDFKKHLKKLTKRDSNLKQRILKKVEEMQNDPFRNSKEYIADLKGKRKMRVGDYRLIYAVCKDCRAKEYEKINNCHKCESKKEDSIVYFDVIHRPHGYDEL